MYIDVYVDTYVLFFLSSYHKSSKTLNCSFLGANASANLMRWLMSGLRRRTLKSFRLSVVTRHTLHVTRVGLSATNTDIQRGKNGLKSEFMHSVRPWNPKSKTSRHQGSLSVWMGESVVTQALSARKKTFAIGIFWTLAGTGPPVQLYPLREKYSPRRRALIELCESS